MRILDDLPDVTREDLEVVSHVMRRFANEGLIKTGRKWIMITDRQKLEDLTN